jgi:DNA-binding NarL/FixJ family response regulator
VWCASCLSPSSRAVGWAPRRSRAPLAWPRFRLVWSHLRGIARYTQGDLTSAIADLESAGAAYLENADRPLPDRQALLALFRLDRDDIPGAVEALSLGTDGAVSRSCSSLFAAGSLKVAQGDLRAGLDALLACHRSVHEMNAPNPAANLPWRAAAAVVSAQLGEKQLARNLIDESLELSRRFGAPGALGIALRSAGLVTGGPAGIRQLAQAVSVLDGSGLDAQLARALVDLGAARRRAGRRREALEALSRGLDLASRCGVLVAMRRAREELVAAGARPRRDRSWGADALTASELRIARMASAGLSNPEIAQALFIARKTVTVHLTRTYHKLGISSRAELADALDDPRAAARDSLISA